MKEAQKISLFWDVRSEQPRDLAKRVADTITWFGSIEPLARQWTVALGRPGEVKRPEIVPATPASLEASVAQGGFPRKEVGPALSYEQETYLGTYRRHRAKLRLVAFAGGQAQTWPNRIELSTYELLEIEPLRKAFLGMVAAFRPSYGHCSIERVPMGGPPPRAGFLTFLDSSFSVPHALPGSVHRSSLASLGTLLQLSTKHFVTASEDYKKQLAALQVALGGPP